MWTLGQIVARSVSDGIDESEATQIANQRHKELVRRSGWLRATVDLGATDGATTGFALPTDVSRVLYLRVTLTDGTVVRYPNHIGEDDYYGILSGDLQSSSNCFTTDEDEDGNVKVMLYPAPANGNLFAKCEKIPADLVLPTDPVAVPDEFVQGLLDGVRSIVFKELDEDAGSSQAMEQSFEASVAGLAAMVNARGVGDGPIAIPMRGVSW